MLRRLMVLATLAAAAAGVFSMAWGATHSRPAMALTNCDTNSAELNSVELQVVAAVNAFRAENGLGALKVSPNLSRASAWMTEDMLAKNYFDHTDSLGRSAFTRMRDCGYGSSGAGENLAMASASAQAVVEMWKGSAGHRANMLNANWVVIGVGNAGPYWATNFGNLDDSGDTGSGGGAPSGPATPTPFPPTSTPLPRFATPTNAAPSASATPVAPTATPTQFAPISSNAHNLPSFVPIRRASIPMIAAE